MGPGRGYHFHYRIPRLALWAVDLVVAEALGGHWRVVYVCGGVRCGRVS